MFDITTIVGIILLLGVTGLLKPIRNLTTSLGNDVDTINEVKGRLVKEWDIDSAIAHAKKMNKAMAKATDMGEIHTYEEVMASLRSHAPSARVEE